MDSKMWWLLVGVAWLVFFSFFMKMWYRAGWTPGDMWYNWEEEEMPPWAQAAEDHLERDEER